MTVMMNSKFTSKFAQVETTLYFCDIGDLFTYLKKKMLGAGTEVKDYTTRNCIDARKAYYVNSSKKFKTAHGLGDCCF
jgi:hypothetical protein